MNTLHIDPTRMAVEVPGMRFEVKMADCERNQRMQKMTNPFGGVRGEGESV